MADHPQGAAGSTEGVEEEMQQADEANGEGRATAADEPADGEAELARRPRR